MSDTSTLDGKSLPIRPLPSTCDLDLQVHPVPDKDGLIVKVQPPKAPSKAIDHVPCDIVLAIDVSGSMGDDAPVPGEGQSEANGLTVLDLTKHAALMVLETMNENDRLGIVTFSYSTTIVQDLKYMTPQQKVTARKNIKSMVADGATNMWHGIRDGLQLFTQAEHTSNVAALMVLTDGMPNHMCPQAGYIPKLRTLSPLPASIHTFGFGYYLRSGLLKSIAEIGSGNFAFIPDAGMIGTVFVHAVANLQATFATNTVLELEYEEPISLRETAGTSVVRKTPKSIADSRTQLSIPLGNIIYGQSRDIFLKTTLQHKATKPAPIIIDAKIKYTSTLQPKPTESKRMIESQVSQICNILSTCTLTEAEIAYHESRSRLCSFLSSQFPIGPDGERRLDGDNSRTADLDLEAKRKALYELTEQLPAKQFSDIQNSSLVEDIIGVEPRGQVLLAISSESNFTRWGKHYLLSLLNAHSRQICNSFKDPGPLQYGVNSPLFIACRDKLDNTFDDLPPPKPTSRRIPKNGQTFRPIVSMASYRNSAGVCFAGSTSVELASGRTVEIRKLRRGVKVRTPVGPRKVAMVLRTWVQDEILCRVGSGSSLLVTPWHPISNIEGKSWTFPAQAMEGTVRFTGCIYSVLLQRGRSSEAHAIRVGGVAWGVTLGHGIVSGRDARAHAYFGDYAKVAKGLVTLGVSKDGIVHGGGVLRDGRTRLVKGFVKPEADGKTSRAVLRRAGLFA